MGQGTPWWVRVRDAMQTVFSEEFYLMRGERRRGKEWKREKGEKGAHLVRTERKRVGRRNFLLK